MLSWVDQESARPESVRYIISLCVVHFDDFGERPRLNSRLRREGHIYQPEFVIHEERQTKTPHLISSSTSTPICSAMRSRLRRVRLRSPRSSPPM